MQDYHAVTVTPATQAEAEAGSDNLKPMTALRTNQAIAALGLDENGVDVASVTAEQAVFNLGVAKQAKFYGVENYMLILGTPDGGSSLLTNGYVTIKGPQITEPFDVEIAGHGDYMLGISSDIGLNPTLVLLTGGPFIRGYNGAGNQAWFVESDGSQTMGQNDSSYLRVGLVQASNSNVLIQAGNVRGYYSEEEHFRYDLNAYLGYVAFAVQGNFSADIVGVKFGCSSAGVAGIWANSPGFSGYVETVRVDAATSADNTGLLLLADGEFKRVVLGADDSGGTGYRMLRVAN